MPSMTEPDKLIHLSQQNSVPSETPGYGLFPNGSKPLWRKTVWKPCGCEQHLKSSNPLPLAASELVQQVPSRDNQEIKQD